MIYPSDFESRIGFDTIRTDLSALCTNEIGQHMVRQISFMPGGTELLRSLSLLSEMILLRSMSAELPTFAYPSLRSHLKQVRPTGASLTLDGAVGLRRLLIAVDQVATFFGRIAQDDTPYPLLSSIIARVDPLPALRQELRRLIDDDGEVRDSASDTLHTIRTTLRRLSSEVGSTMQSVLSRARAEGWVEHDASPTIRDGRMLLPVIPHAKRQVPGIVYDESATGRTLYVEPEAVVQLNNRIREAMADERREINRLLRALSTEVRPHIRQLQDQCTALGILDFVHAKAELAARMDALVPPRSEDGTSMEWWRARHPLLEQHLQRQGRSIVPLDIRLSADQRILVISGPNAGGKSATLKTVALLQYMLQCGLAIPLLGHSTVRFFEHLMIDIGDQQSLENDLSTYSSHLRNMKAFVRHGDAHTLIMIDEFGSGTEPHIGGALAEALLDRFRTNGAYGVITTHYSNLKDYCEEHDGMVNGAMLFDRQLIKPLFQLHIGQPGSSFAIEIARATGLPEEIIKYASDLVGDDYMKQDAYLQDIMRDRAYWSRKRGEVKVLERQLEQKMADLDEKLSHLRSKRAELLDSAQREALRIIQDSNSAVERTIREIKEAQAERESTLKARAVLKQQEDKLQTRIRRRDDGHSRHRHDAPKEGTKPSQGGTAPTLQPKPTDIGVGSSVTLRGSNTVGEVLELRRTKALVRMGGLTMEVSLAKLSPSLKQASAIPTRPSAVIEAQNDERRLSFKSSIDLRGARVDEALQSVTYFIDDAVRYGFSPVRILHGTGTGALREAIRQYLETNPKVASYTDEHPEQGGAGITVVTLQ